MIDRQRRRHFRIDSIVFGCLEGIIGEPPTTSMLTQYWTSLKERVSIRSFTSADSTVLDCFGENLRTFESSLFASTTWRQVDEPWQRWTRETNVDSRCDPFVSFACQDCRLGRVNVCKVAATNCNEHRCSTNSERSILDDSSAPLSCLPRPITNRTKCET